FVVDTPGALPPAHPNIVYAGRAVCCQSAEPDLASVLRKREASISISTAHRYAFKSATVDRIAHMRVICSPGDIRNPSASLRADLSIAYGLMIKAPASSRAAPANWLRSNTP